MVLDHLLFNKAKWKKLPSQYIGQTIKSTSSNIYDDPDFKLPAFIKTINVPDGGSFTETVNEAVINTNGDIALGFKFETGSSVDEVATTELWVKTSSVVGGVIKPLICFITALRRVAIAW